MISQATGRFEAGKEGSGTEITIESAWRPGAGRRKRKITRGEEQFLILRDGLFEPSSG